MNYIPFDGSYGDPGNPPAPTDWKNVDGLQLDMDELDSEKYYYVEADICIIQHNSKDSSFYGGLLWPVEIRLGLADANNARRIFNWGFLDGVDSQGKRPYTQIEGNSWYHYRSPELRGLWDVTGKAVAYPIDRIFGLSITAQGYGLKSGISNVDVFEYDIPQVSSPGSGPYSEKPFA
jgi:hypothetical protein